MRGTSDEDELYNLYKSVSENNIPKVSRTLKRLDKNIFHKYNINNEYFHYLHVVDYIVEIVTVPMMRILMNHGFDVNSTNFLDDRNKRSRTILFKAFTQGEENPNNNYFKIADYLLNPSNNIEINFNFVYDEDKKTYLDALLKNSYFTKSATKKSLDKLFNYIRILHSKGVKIEKRHIDQLYNIGSSFSMVAPVKIKAEVNALLFELKILEPRPGLGNPKPPPTTNNTSGIYFDDGSYKQPIPNMNGQRWQNSYIPPEGPYQPYSYARKERPSQPYSHSRKAPPRKAHPPRKDSPANNSRKTPPRKASPANNSRKTPPPRKDSPANNSRKTPPASSPPLKPDDSLEEIVDKINKYTDKTSPYKVLGLEEPATDGVRDSATDAKITKAYKKLMLKLHPDKCKLDDKSKCDEAFKKVNAAKLHFFPDDHKLPEKEPRP